MADRTAPLTAPVWGIDSLRVNSDGEGVCTLVCLHRCPLRCAYCINKRGVNRTDRILNITPAGLYKAVKRDSVYFSGSGGGVVFGGGEPLLYSEFILAFSRLCPDDWQIRVETSLNVPRKNVELLTGCADEWIIDIKDSDSAIYKAYTGADNTAVWKNLDFLISSVGSEKLTVRVPHIPGYNTDEDVGRTLARLNAAGITKTDVFDYIKK